MKVFLGGTCNGSLWRDELIKKLKVDYFNPVVDNWNEEARQREIEERENSDFRLYVLTPKMKGIYAIAEVVEDAIKNPDETILCIIGNDGKFRFTPAMMKSVNAVKDLVKRNNAIVLESLDEIAEFLNGK